MKLIHCLSIKMLRYEHLPKISTSTQKLHIQTMTAESTQHIYNNYTNSSSIWWDAAKTFHQTHIQMLTEAAAALCLSSPRVSTVSKQDCLWLNELEEGWFKMNPFTKGTQWGFLSPGAHLNGGGLVSCVRRHECHKNPEPSNTVCTQQHAGTEMGLRNGKNGGKGRIHKIYKKRC